MGSKFVAGIVLGAVAGAALALFLTSDTGKEILEDITDAAGGAADTAKKKLESLNGELDALLKKGKAFVEDLEHKAKEATA